MPLATQYRARLLLGAEYSRLEQMGSMQWGTLDAMGQASSRMVDIVEERTKQLAELKGSFWLDATL